MSVPLLEGFVWEDPAAGAGFFSGVGIGGRLGITGTGLMCEGNLQEEVRRNE